MTYINNDDMQLVDSARAVANIVSSFAVSNSATIALSDVQSSVFIGIAAAYEINDDVDSEPFLDWAENQDEFAIEAVYINDICQEALSHPNLSDDYRPAVQLVHELMQALLKMNRLTKICENLSLETPSG